MWGEHINLRQEFIFKKLLNTERGGKQLKEGDQYMNILNTILITANINAINMSGTKKDCEQIFKIDLDMLRL